MGKYFLIPKLLTQSFSILSHLRDPFTEYLPILSSVASAILTLIVQGSEGILQER